MEQIAKAGYRFFLWLDTRNGAALLAHASAGRIRLQRRVFQPMLGTQGSPRRKICNQGDDKMAKEKPLTQNDILKYEIAEELGLTDKINQTGWKSLTSKESGRIGGLMTKRKRAK
jgi:hypothetical protein